MEQPLLPAEVADHVEDVLARLIASAHAEGDPVVRVGDFPEQPVEGGPVVEDLRDAGHARDRRIVPVHGHLHAGLLSHGDHDAVQLEDPLPDLLVGRRTRRRRHLLRGLPYVNVQVLVTTAPFLPCVDARPFSLQQLRSLEDLETEDRDLELPDDLGCPGRVLYHPVRVGMPHVDRVQLGIEKVRTFDLEPVRVKSVDDLLERHRVRPFLRS